MLVDNSDEQAGTQGERAVLSSASYCLILCNLMLACTHNSITDAEVMHLIELHCHHAVGQQLADLLRFTLCMSQNPFASDHECTTETV